MEFRFMLKAAGDLIGVIKTSSPDMLRGVVNLKGRFLHLKGVDTNS